VEKSVGRGVNEKDEVPIYNVVYPNRHPP